MTLRGNLRELRNKLRSLLKPALVPVVFFLVFSLVAVFFAITQERADEDNPNQGNMEDGSFSVEYAEAVDEPEYIPEYPAPRWYRSNAGGMALEETPSRLGALRNEYALVIDYVPSDELEPRLSPFYKDEYIIEIRVLYKEGKETRRQWLLRDKTGNTRVNAVFRPVEDEDVQNESGYEEPVSAGAQETNKLPETRVPSGFIEVYNEKGHIVMDFSLFEDGGEILTEYTYKGNALITAETKTRDPYAGEYRPSHTDNYRYNRSNSLRNVERVFHEASASLGAAGLEPILLVFPGRVLAYDKDFLKEKLTLTSEFFGDLQRTETGFRMVYDTDSKGRVLSETMYNARNEVVWTLTNTWAGDRISSILKIEGGDKRLIEYEYDGSGNRIAERDIRNGVLERQVLINGVKETEELYLNGVVVLRAFWEDGRKISEERVRRR